MERVGRLCVVGLSVLVGCYGGLDVGEPSGGADGSITAADGDGGSADEGGDDGTPAEYEPAPAAIRLLLSHQYVAAIGDLLGPAAEEAAAPPADIAINGFSSIGATQLALGDVEVDAFESSARAVAAAAMTDTTRIAELQGCTPSGPADEACYSQFTERFGRLVFRRPLEAVEVDQYVGVALAAASEGGAFEAGIEASIATFLQSPNFLYQVEVGELDPDHGDRRRLTGYEMATRLSFFVLGSTPDEFLLDDAEAGMLDTPGGVRAAAEDMMTRVEAREAFGNFAAEVYRLRDLEVLPKDATTFPTYDAELAQAMGQETLRFIEHVAWEREGDFREIFDADYTFVNDKLAAHYGISGTFGPDFVQVTLPPEQKRGGILGHASVLSLFAHVTSTSPTLRGKFVRESIMCQTIPAPPPEVATDLPSGETETLRERLEQHMADPACAGCHALMDPIGFGLESYDGIGAFRTLENGLTVDDSSELEGQPFAGSRELGAILRENPTTATCLVRNLYRHATGHLETDSELEILEDVSDTYADSGYRLQAALVEIVSSPAFRVVGVPQ